MQQRGAECLENHRVAHVRRIAGCLLGGGGHLFRNHRHAEFVQERFGFIFRQGSCYLILACLDHWVSPFR